jgi:hypothetical protein
MQWLVLSRDSLQGFNGAHRAHNERPYEPASQFPHFQDFKVLISDRAGPLSTTLSRERPPGGSTATYNFIRVAQATGRCKLYGTAHRTALNGGKANNLKHLHSGPTGCGKHSNSVGNQALCSDRAHVRPITVLLFAAENRRRTRLRERPIAHHVRLKRRWQRHLARNRG